jgi:hypothetical protein
LSLFKLFDWWGEAPVARAMNSAVRMFPAVEILHMLGIVFLVDLAAIVDLRLLGVRLTNTPVSVLSSEPAPWTTAGFVLGIDHRAATSLDRSHRYSSVSFLWALPLSIGLRTNEDVTYHVSDLLLHPFCAVVASAVIYS